MRHLVLNTIAYVYKKFDYILCSSGAGTGGYVGAKLFDDWFRPIIVATLCAVIGLLVNHFGKKLLKKWKL